MYDNYDALIFDMDGTLVDSGQLHEFSWKATLDKYEIPLDKNFMRSLAGVPTKGTLEILLEKYQITPKASLAEMNEFKEQWVHENMQKFVKPTALIEIAKKYQGIKPMAIGTGATTAEANTILTLCDLKEFMTVIVGADQVQNPKPAPDTFLRCAQLLNVAPENCVVFEDSKLGLQAAASAGMVGIDVLLVHNIENNYFL
jgi:beta-phosphoglucomutase family hydrolase